MDHIDRERLVTYADLQHALDQRLAQVNDLLATVERVKALHVVANTCGCESCRGERWCASDKMLWPCPTIKALEQI